MSDTQILNLDAELKRAEITYEGNTYQLRNRSELSILEAHQFSELLKEHADLIVDDMDEESAKKIGDVLQSIAATLVIDPPEAGFPDQLCAAILGFWTEQHSDGEDDEAVPPPRARKAPQDRKPKSRSTTAR